MFISKREFYEEVSVRLQEGVDFTAEDLEDNLLVGGRLKELTSKARNQIAFNNGFRSMHWAGHYDPETRTIECTLRRPFYMDEVGATTTSNSYDIDIEIEDETMNHHAIVVVLHKLGVPPHLIGYNYLRQAIYMAVKDYSVISSITKTLYPTIAEDFHTTPSRVERAIRHAIESSYSSRGMGDSLSSMVGWDITRANGKITNSEFIALVAEYLQMRLKGDKYSIIR